MSRCWSVALVTLLALPSLVHADRASSQISDYAVIQNGEGAARVLFRCTEIPLVEGITVRRATLTVPISGSAEPRSLHLQLHPVTATWNPLSVDWATTWSRPGGDFDDELYARTQVDLARGATTATLDVTTIVKELVEAGMSADGFILSVTPHEGEGIRVEDVSRLAGLAGATLSVSYTKIPSVERRRG